MNRGDYLHMLSSEEAQAQHLPTDQRDKADRPQGPLF